MGRVKSYYFDNLENDIGIDEDTMQEDEKLVFEELDKQRVYLEGIVLKPNMIVSGIDCIDQASVEKVAEWTVKCLKATVPSDVPGCAFLSGGQSSEDATAHLNAMNAGDACPWALSYSYGRALQESALKSWGLNQKDSLVAQGRLLKRAHLNSAACAAQYVGEAA